MTEDIGIKSQLINEQSAENISRVEELAYELKVNEVMTRDIKLLTLEMSMSEVIDLLRIEKISGAPVISASGNLIGIISMEDIIRCLVRNDLAAPVTHYMSPNPITIGELEPVVEALKKFVATGLGRLVVINTQGTICGILTKGDVTRGFLKALQKDFQSEEIKRFRASHLFEDIISDRTSLILRYDIKQGDFTHGGAASSNIKRALVRLGANPQIARRVGIAIYEAEMNIIIHTTDGGTIRVEIEPHQITIDAYDHGPGIKDIQQAMRPGYSTATETVRELGFGAGMGLVNISRCIDNMKLESVVGKGTRLKMRIFMPSEETVGERSSRLQGETI